MKSTVYTLREGILRISYMLNLEACLTALVCPNGISKLLWHTFPLYKYYRIKYANYFFLLFALTKK
jgi:hypothetical protein